MIRATTGGVLRGYRTNLTKSFVTLNKARETVLTHRNFNSYAENPAAAAKAFQLRKSRMSVESQYSICDDTYRKFQTAWTSLDSISKLIDTDNGSAMKTISGTTLNALNDPTADARVQLGKALDQMSENIIQNLNQKYGENFIFSGADGQNVPFEVVDNKLYYRGIPVDATEPSVVLSGGSPQTVDSQGNLDPNGSYYICSDSVSTMKASDFDAITDPTKQPQVMRDAAGNPVKVDQAGNLDPNGDYVMVTTDIKTMSKAQYKSDMQNAEKLEYLAEHEKYFVDIGLGFQENEKGQLIESSGFNAALNGLTFIGYGVDKDGDPRNIYSLVQKMKDLTARVSDGKWEGTDGDEFTRLVKKLEAASSNFKTEYTNMDAGTTKLENNLQLLKENFYNLQEQYSALEDADMVESISNFIWAQYCYNSALKVGNSVLSESLMDYLN